MDRISAPGNINGQFTDGDPQTGTPATILDSLWCNGTQEELIGLIEETGGTPSPTELDQVRLALRRFASRRNLLFNAHAYQVSALGNVPRSYPISGVGQYLADGWALSTQDAEITLVALSNLGIKIQGSGQLGGHFEIYPVFSEFNTIARGVNHGVGDIPRTQFTGGIRAVSLAADNGVKLTMEAEPAGSVSSICTVDNEIFTPGEVGGNANASGLAVVSFRVTSPAANWPANVSLGPLFRFTLQAAGPFTIYLTGAGLYNSLVAAEHFPPLVVGNYLYDAAVGASLYPPEAYDQTIKVEQYNGIGDVASTPVATDVYIWVPWRTKLADSSPIPPNVEITAVSGYTYNPGLSSGAAWSTINAAYVTFINQHGFTVRINASHALITAGDFHRFHATFTAHYRKDYIPA